MKRESQLWLEKAERAIKTAKRDITPDSLDLSINRSYYAMFYIAQALLADIGLKFRKHGTTHGAYGKHFAKTNVLDPKFHNWLLKAFDQRILSDYGIESEVQSQEAKILSDRAEEFLEASRNYLSSKK